MVVADSVAISRREVLQALASPATAASARPVKELSADRLDVPGPARVLRRVVPAGGSVVTLAGVPETLRLHHQRTVDELCHGMLLGLAGLRLGLPNMRRDHAARLLLLRGGLTGR